MGSRDFMGSRVITQEYFDTIRMRALLIAGDESVYDAILDARIEKIVRGIIHGFFRNPADADDALQEIKLHCWKNITHYLTQPQCNKKEVLEAWICNGAKWTCLNLYHKNQHYAACEYHDEITGEDIDQLYDAADGDQLDKIVEYIWNINTEPTKVILFVLSKTIPAKAIAAENAGGRLNNYSGAVQQVAWKYAGYSLSPTTDADNASEVIVRYLVQKMKTAFSDAVWELDQLLVQSGYAPAQVKWFDKIVAKLNRLEGDRRSGSQTVAEAVCRSRKDSGLNKHYIDSSGHLHIDDDLVRLITEYITKSNYRIRGALTPVAPADYEMRGK